MDLTARRLKPLQRHCLRRNVLSSTPDKVSTTLKRGASLKELAELLGAPVTTSLGGKSAFPENHPLALGSGGRAIPKPVHHFLQKTDLILGIGCSFTRTGFGVRIPEGKRVIHATLDPADINKDVPVETALVGDAGLILDGLVEAVRDRTNGTSEERKAAVTGEISAVKAEWLEQWKSKLTSDEVPMTPYRVIRDLTAYRRCRKHDYHTRRGESTRPNVAVLAVRCPAHLYRLGAKRRSSVTVLDSPWVRNLPDRIISVSMSGVMPLSALRVWILRLLCVRESRFCQCSSIISPWQLRSRLCLSPPKNSVLQTSQVTTQTWRRAFGGLR